MSDSWSKVILGDVATIQTGRSNRQDAVPDGSFPLFDRSQEPKRSNRYLLNCEAVIVPGEGREFVPRYYDGPFDLHQRVYALSAFKGIDGRFLYYALTAHRAYFAQVATGATVKSLRKGMFEQFAFRAPGLGTQRKIAAVLSVYDALIENNLRRIEILEEIARNLYREWFLEFRFPGHEHVRSAESTLGPLPEEWRVVRLSSLISRHIGGGWGKESRDPDHTEPAWVLRGTDLRNARQCDFTSVPRRWHTAQNLASRRLAPGDLVLEVSGGSKGQPLGRSLQVTEQWLRPFKGEAVMCASFCKRVRAEEGRIAPEVLFFGLLEARASGQMAAYEVQSTGISNLQWKHFIEGTKWSLPPTGLQHEFCEMVDALSAEGTILGRRNAVLRTTRDLLMPKLVSGELDVSDLRVRATPPRSNSVGAGIIRYDFFRQITALAFVDRVVLFGSRARDDHEEHSDIDLAVFCDDASDDEWLQVLDCLRADRTDTLLKVDCVRFDRCDAVLQENVLAEGVVIYEKDGRR